LPRDLSERPALSVVIAAWTGNDALRRCLSSVLPQIDPGRDEIIIARNFELHSEVSRQAASPGVIDLPLPVEATVPALRAAGLFASRRPIVAFVEDHCACSPGWRNAIVLTHELACQAVGGPVDLAPAGRPLDWAVYFFDYARFSPPVQPGPARSLSGANMSYKRSALDTVGPVLQQGVFEVVIEQTFRDRHFVMLLAPDAVVVHKKRHQAGRTVGFMFALARGYAAQRLLGAGALKRALFGAGSVALPLLLASRILAATLGAPRHLWRLTIAAPWIAILLATWSLGELTGYLLGAGDSLSKWH
jgi:hypothetical protein